VGHLGVQVGGKEREMGGFKPLNYYVLVVGYLGDI
jgi:hypothetical protein